MPTLNLGILAHVDAGKTTLTERLLYAAGVIDEPGDVDAGTTQTDSLPLEQRRGITIKSAVVSFMVGDLTVNVIDTPGHPDFIAEVDRALRVLDGAVLLISAVEGVQPQTRILMRALERLHLPTVIFVNKIDRAGADEDRVLRSIADRLTPAIVPMGSTSDLGTRAADFHPWDRAGTVSAEEAHPVFFGSALTGAGVATLMAGIAELLPPAPGDAGAPLSGRVFKIERRSGGERLAYVRLFTGTVRVRDRVVCGRRPAQRVTAIDVFERGGAVRREAVHAGQIAIMSGLGEVQVGDPIGERADDEARAQFAPPTLASAVVPVYPEHRERLRVALGQLAEQDPLINVRQDDAHDELSVSLYGEVQKEVIGAMLADDFGIDVSFRETTTICIERPVGTGADLALLQDDENPYSATVGLHIEPGGIGSGVQFRLHADPRTVPTHIYKTADQFLDRMTQYTRGALERGLFGWQVADCVVTMTQCGYYASDGPTKPTRPTTRTTAADFRKLTPIVLRRALARAGTVVCEPMMRVRIEAPSDTLGAVVAAVARRGGALAAPAVRGELSIVETVLPAAHAQELQRLLPGATGGEAVVDTTFAGYAPGRSPVT
jgi:ribosomal protection tetracycline resistance protein